MEMPDKANRCGRINLLPSMCGIAFEHCDGTPRQGDGIAAQFQSPDPLDKVNSSVFVVMKRNAIGCRKFSFMPCGKFSKYREKQGRNTKYSDTFG